VVDVLRADLIYAIRVWRRRPGTTAVAVFALAIGIAANTTVFSFIFGMLLKPLQYADPDRLVMVWQDRSAKGGPRREVISPGLFIDWSTRATTLDGVAAILNWSPNLTDSAGTQEPERLTGASVSGAYFTTLGIPPAIGRVFTRDDDQPGAPPVAVISDGLWRRRFAADRAVVGRTIPLDGVPVDVIGVMPASFQGASIDADIWNTLRIDPANAPRGIVMLTALARLAPSVTFEQAQAAMSTLQVQLQREDPELAGQQARLIRLQDDMVGPVKPLLIVLGAAVALVLLIACANVASILMARACERRVEMAVRIAVGAGRGRLVRQLLTESAVLAVAGCACGLALAYAGVHLLLAMAPPQAPRLRDVHLDAVALLFTAAITVFAALVAGLAPALTAWSAALISDLREGAHETLGFTRARSVIVIGEVAAAMTLVVGAGLFVRSLIALEDVNLGFHPDHVLTASVALPRGSYRGDEQVRGLFDRLIDRAGQIHGVTSASMTSVLPLSGMQIKFNFRIEGRPPARTPDEEPVASFRSVGARFFQAMGMTIAEGRGFSSNDREGAPMVVVVNRALVARYFEGQSPVGSHVFVNGDRATIVGIVADVHHAGPAMPPDAEVYVPYAQLSARGGWIVVRTTGDPSSIAAELRHAVLDIDPHLPLASVRTMDALVARSVAQPRFLATLLTSFSSVAAMLALVGVYGLLEFSVSRRTREIGVRMALGAGRLAVLAMVLRQSLFVVGTGVVIGALASVGLSQMARSLLFGVPPGDPQTVVAMAILIVIASLVASYVPARRAARVDPAIALRDE
jgi:putative ABC transport system permease protein